MKIAVVGLGKMGMQIVQRLLHDSHEVIAIDPNHEAVEQAVKYGASQSSDRANALEKFGDDKPIVWLMIPAGLVDQELDEWLKVLPAESIIIDGGNSDFRDTKKHAALADQKNIHLVDVGTSGGVLGITNGFSMMVGGDKSSAEFIEPVLDCLAKPSGAHHYFGESGSGHYVKMVHNAIEYGVMESLAEGYRALKEGAYAGLDLAAAGEVWQHGSIIKSDLNALVVSALEKNPELAGITGYVAENGEARWTLEIAREKGFDMPAIQTALDVRLESQKGKTNFATKILAALRNEFGGHNLNSNG